MCCRCSCALPSRLQSAQHCTKPRSAARIVVQTVFDRTFLRRAVKGRTRGGICWRKKRDTSVFLLLCAGKATKTVNPLNVCHWKQHISAKGVVWYTEGVSFPRHENPTLGGDQHWSVYPVKASSSYFTLFTLQFSKMFCQSKALFVLWSADDVLIPCESALSIICKVKIPPWWSRMFCQVLWQ